MPSRVSTAQLYHSTQSNVASAREKEATSGEKASTQKEILRPSQDPRGWMISTNLKDDLSIRDSTAKNAGLATHVLNATENLLTQVQEYSQRAYELAVDSGDTMTSHQKRQLVLAEIQNLYQITLQSLNSRYGDRTLLSGFKSDKPAFDHEGKYVGDNGKIEIEIDRGVIIPVNISVNEAILGKGLQHGVDIPQAFHTLMAGLANDDPKLVGESITNFQRSIDQLSIARGDIGARMNMIERAKDSHANIRTDNLEAISKVEEVDAIKAFSDLARDQAVLNASLQSTHKILTETPTDILFR